MTRVLACLAIGAWVFLLWPFPITTFMATCMACVTYPAYRKLHRKMSPSWAMTTYTVGLAAITILPIATVVSLVTLAVLPEEPVRFGVLTFLGSAMLLTGVLEPLLKKIPPAAGLAVSAVLFALTYHLDERWLGFGGLRLALPDAWYANYFTAFFGFLPFDFYSTDYFALLPWLFLFWAGYFLHGVVGRARMEPLRRSVCPALGWMGRHSLLLYLLHQPVIYGVLSAAAVLFA